MFNPLCLFSSELLDALVKAGQVYFVRQTYNRGKTILDDDIKGFFLITHYPDLRGSKEHYEALINDGNRFLYEWSNPEHQTKLKIASAQPQGYKVFASLVMPDVKIRAEKVLKQKIKNYIDHKLKWHPGREDTVDFDMYPNFGEVFVTIKLRNQKIKVALEEIEKFK